MKFFYSICLLLLLSSSSLLAQTSWTGTTSTNWSIATNWTAGVPTSTVNAVVGDASFTGTFQPTFTVTSTCNTLTIGGSRVTTLALNKSLTVYGGLTINAGSTLTHSAGTLSVKGNWTNNGTYNATVSTATVKFAGTAQSINGPVITDFKRLTINSGSTTTLNTNTTVAGIFTISGTFVPAEVATPYMVSGAATTINGSAAVLKVNAASYAGNYPLSGLITLSAGSTVDYCATLVNQTIKENLTYSTLKISGVGVKTLGGNLNALNSIASTRGNIYVIAGTLDMAGFSANRGTTLAGGTFSVSNGAFLKIGSANTFPVNYTTNTLSLTSTVEYYGSGAQTVTAKTYGNLILSSASGASAKTMPATAFTVAGNFTSTVGAGTSVSYAAGADMTVTGTVTIGAATTFDGGSFTHKVAGHWTNNGTFTGNASTVIINTSGGILSGAGTNNFYNLTLGSSNITGAAGLNVSVAGNLATTGAGSFTQAAGATLYMTGASKTISGTGIVLDNLDVSGTVTASTGLTIKGNLAAAGTLTCSAGNVIMNGAGKTISGTGSVAFSSLSVSGTITSSANISLATALNVSGSLSATAGTTSFVGINTTMNGTANLFGVTLSGTSLQLSTNAILGIADLFTVTGSTLNVTSSTPNTVAFNGGGTQVVNNLAYHHLVLSGGGTKTASGNMATNGDLTISSGTTFDAASFTHTVKGNWINNGSLTAGTSNITFTGAADATLTGATTFNILTVNKTSATNQVSILSNVSVPTINMTNGVLSTGANILTITTTRTGPGILLGNIRRTHSFTTGIAYAFEGPDNSITFAAVSGVTSVTVNVTKGSIADFPFGGSINRAYNITVPAGTYTATLRLHYDDAEANGNNESSMQAWQYNGTSWVAVGKSANSTSANYVEQSGLTNITDRWTLSDDANVARWTGAASNDWATASNWTVIQGTPALPPAMADVAEIGTAAFTNHPSISSAATAKNIVFGSAQAVTLGLLSGGSLTTQGNIEGSWSSNTTHTINVNGQTLSIGGDLVLSDGTSGHAVNLNIGAGTLNITGSLTQKGGAAITATGAASFNVAGHFNYINGTFTPAGSTFTYNGSGSQLVAGVTYKDLVINKSAGIASLNTSAAIGGHLSVTAGELDVNAATSVSGNVTIASGATINGDGVTTSVAGNWHNNGTFISLSGTVNLNGTGAQSIAATTFNNLSINKASGTATLTGHLSINGNLAVIAGTLDLATFKADRSSFGGDMSVADGAGMLAGGANNFPANYASYALGSNSTVTYAGTVAQSVSGITYGNLTFSNGGSNAKTLAGPSTVNGNLTINSGASFDAGAHTIGLYGNWVNSGTFIPATSTLLFQGSGKIISGTTTFNKTAMYGSYTGTGGNLTFNGTLRILAGGSFDAGTGSDTVKGDLLNSGSLISYGVTTFTGTVVQNISFINALMSNSFGVINFNGSVSPNLNSTSTPTYATVNVNNTGGVIASVPWLVNVAFNIGSGATFNGGVSTHTILGSFTNNGTVISSGTMAFTPTAPQVIKLSGTGFTSTGTVLFGGSGAISVTGAPTALNDVVIANTAGVTPASGWTVGRNFSIYNGGIFNAGSLSYTVAGDIESDGILNGGTSTFTTTSSNGLIAGSPATTFYDYVNNGSMAVTADFNVARNFTNNSSFSDTVGTVNMTGSVAGTIGGSTTPFKLPQFAINKSAGSIVTLTKNITGVTRLDIISGILDAAAFTISQDATGGVLAIANGAALRIGGSNGLPAFTTYAFDTLSSVEFAGGNQPLSASAPYGDLVITAGTKTAAAPLHILHDFILSAGTFDSGGFSDTLGGNFNMTGGVFIGGNTIFMNGAADQDIRALTSFNNLTINKPSGIITQSGHDTVTGTLTLVKGKFALGNYNLFVTAPVSGGSAASYLVATGAGTLLQPVANGGSKNFPVGNAAAYLPATVALTAGSAVDTLSVRVQDSAFFNGSSGVTAKSGVVNATWHIAENTAGGSNATVTLQWPASMEIGSFNRASCKLAHYTGGLWDYGVFPMSATGSDPYSVSRSGFTSFSPFAVSGINALPLTWLSFTGTCAHAAHQLSWSTADEQGVDHFAVEVSRDGSHFAQAGLIAADQQAGAVHNYSFINREVPFPVAYYRIRQVDRNGDYAYSKTIRINGCVTAADNQTIALTENPVTGHVGMSINMLSAGLADIRIIDVTGRLFLKQTIALKSGHNDITIPLTGMAPGIYYLQFSDNAGSSQTIKFMKQ